MGNTGRRLPSLQPSRWELHRARATGTAGAAVTGIGRDAAGGSVARPFGRAIGRDPSPKGEGPAQSKGHNSTVGTEFWEIPGRLAAGTIGFTDHVRVA